MNVRKGPGPGFPSEAPFALRLGRYEVILRIARGGVGEVYLARVTGVGGFERLYAVKVVHPYLSSDPSFSKALLHEARLASLIRHRNIVDIVDVGVHRDTHYLVMEYVDGCTLSELCLRHREYRPLHLIGPIMLDALEGLQAAHELQDENGVSLRLVHRDFSPQNLLVRMDGTCLVADFGIARTSTVVRTTNPGTVKGKPSFMAPEQLTGEEIDQRTDIFAAGVTLWNALTGKRLFDGTTEAATIYNVLRRRIPKPSDIGLRPDPDFDPIVLKALQRRPEARFQTAAQMGHALRELLIRKRLLGAARDIAAWVNESFGPRIEARRNLIHKIDAGVPMSSTVRSSEFDSASGARLPRVSSPLVTPATGVSASHHLNLTPHDLTGPLLREEGAGLLPRIVDEPMEDGSSVFRSGIRTTDADRELFAADEESVWAAPRKGARRKVLVGTLAMVGATTAAWWFWPAGSESISGVTSAVVPLEPFERPSELVSRKWLKPESRSPVLEVSVERESPPIEPRSKSDFDASLEQNEPFARPVPRKHRRFKRPAVTGAPRTKASTAEKVENTAVLSAKAQVETPLEAPKTLLHKAEDPDLEAILEVVPNPYR